MCKYFTYLTCFILLLGLFGSYTVSAADEIWREAESSDNLTAPMEMYDDDPLASGGKYIGVAAGNNSTAAPPAPDGTASYVFTVPATGTYKVVARMKISPTTYDDDSCWIRIGGATLNTSALNNGFFKMNGLADAHLLGAGDWKWVTAYNDDDGRVEVEFTMDPGQYTLEIAYREDGLYIDGLLITDDLALATSDLPDVIPAAGVEPVDPGIEDLVAYYPLDEGSGVVVADASGNGHDGIILGDPNNCWVEGAPDLQTALLFGTAGCDGVDCNMWDPSADTNELSIASWVEYFSGGTTWQGIIANRTGYDPATNHWALECNGGTGEFYFGSRNGSAYGLGFMPEGEWAHLGITFDGEALVAYLNGEEVNSSTSARFGDDKNSTVRIGASEASGNIFEGAIDDVRIYNRVLSVNEVLFLATPPQDSGTEGLVAYYPLDGDVTDASGNGNDGVIMGDPGFVDGIAGQALDLDGDGDYIDCGAAEMLGMLETNAMTAAAWVTIRSIPAAWSAVVAKGEYSWRISNANMDPRFHFGITIWNAPDTFGTDGVAAVGLDEWHHVAGTFDGTNINLYVDGVLDVNVTTTEPIGANEANVLIGENPESAGRYWDGLIDEVMIYNRALSDAEIALLAQ